MSFSKNPHCFLKYTTKQSEVFRHCFLMVYAKRNKSTNQFGLEAKANLSLWCKSEDFR